MLTSAQSVSLRSLDIAVFIAIKFHSPIRECTGSGGGGFGVASFPQLVSEYKKTIRRERNVFAVLVAIIGRAFSVTWGWSFCFW